MALFLSGARLPVMNKAAALLAMALAAALTGCTSAQERAMQNSQPYRAGYSDGCLAATNAGASYRHGPVQNEEAFNSIPAYRAGWKSGYSSCRRTVRAPGAESGNPIPDPSPGH